MGAVFALFSAWYFWIPKMLGLDYNRRLGKAHFLILFIGVNVTFFPQHFLGLQGMPRRISDYPDAFAGWNLISSLGSILSVVATGLFLYIVYVQLVEGNAASRYPWLTPQLYSDSLQTLLNRSYNGLEWALSSPPKPHAFVSLPLQSTIETLIEVAKVACETYIDNYHWANSALNIFERISDHDSTAWEDVWLNSRTFSDLIDKFEDSDLEFNPDHTVNENLSRYKYKLKADYNKTLIKVQLDAFNSGQRIPDGPRLGRTGILSHIPPFPRG
jgi:hypothetical protein